MISSKARPTKSGKPSIWIKLVEQLYDFYFLSRRGTYILYGLTFSIVFIYASIMILGLRRLGRSVMFEGALLASFLLLVLPFLKAFRLTLPKENEFTGEEREPRPQYFVFEQKIRKGADWITEEIQGGIAQLRVLTTQGAPAYALDSNGSNRAGTMMEIILEKIPWESVPGGELEARVRIHRHKEINRFCYIQVFLSAEGKPLRNPSHQIIITPKEGTWSLTLGKLPYSAIFESPPIMEAEYSMIFRANELDQKEIRVHGIKIDSHFLVETNQSVENTE